MIGFIHSMTKIPNHILNQSRKAYNSTIVYKARHEVEQTLKGRSPRIESLIRLRPHLIIFMLTPILSIIIFYQPTHVPFLVGAF